VGTRPARLVGRPRRAQSIFSVRRLAARRASVIRSYWWTLVRCSASTATYRFQRGGAAYRTPLIHSVGLTLDQSRLLALSISDNGLISSPLGHRSIRLTLSEVVSHPAGTIGYGQPCHRDSVMSGKSFASPDPVTRSGTAMPDIQTSPPSWLPDQQIVLAQLASGIIEYAQRATAGGAFRLPYPANLQLALDRLTLLAWWQGAPAPTSVVDLLQLAEQPFGDWKISPADADVDPDEPLLAYGRPTVTCEELGSLRGDVDGEIRENALMRAVMATARAAAAPGSYVAFRELLIRHPAITAFALDARLAGADLAVLSDEVRDAYRPAPPEAIADGVVRTCGGCNGLRLPLEDDRTWACQDEACPAPEAAGVEHPAAEDVRWLRCELRTFITAPGRAELRI